jgi:hypothetical protein
MSHFTKCELKLTNLTAIKAALEELEYNFAEAEEGQHVMVRGWRGQQAEAVVGINMGKYDIGVVLNADGTYTLQADWWGVETSKGVSEAEFVKKLSQRYQYHNVMQACEAKGYTLEEEEVEEDGTVKLYVRRWVAD